MMLVRCLALAAVASTGLGALNWATPLGVPDKAPVWDKVKPIGLDGAARTFTEAELHDRFNAVDWFPTAHPPIPRSVASGHGGAGACGFCHLPDGAGRPENAALAGLPATYIEAQAAAFAAGRRKPLDGAWTPTLLMTKTSEEATASEVKAAAEYFSRLKFKSHVHVVEAAQIPHPIEAFYVYRLDRSRTEPIGVRIIETPDSMEAFEKRDPRLGYTAYAPPGSIAGGAALARSGGPAGQPCAACHGSGLKGGIAPPLAGRSPSYILRQLFSFREGARNDPGAAAMQPVTQKLSNKDIVSLAAYAASLQP
jgi:cytochrome c553